MAKAISKTEEKALAKIEQDEAELFAGADNASESFDRDDIVIPRLVILQSNSPQTQKRENTYVEGAEPGMIHDTVSGELWDGEEGIVILPVYFRHTYVEWIIRENGGGFVADHGMVGGKELLATTTRDETTGRDMLPNGNQLVNTLEYVVYQLSDEGYSQAILTMTSSQLRKGRNWNSNIMKPLGKDQPAPFYGRAFRFTTVPESNEKGNWFGWAIAFECRFVELLAKGYKWCDLAEFNKQCAEFRKLLVDEKLKIAPPTVSTEGESDSEAL